MPTKSKQFLIVNDDQFVNANTDNPNTTSQQGNLTQPLSKSNSNYGTITGYSSGSPTNPQNYDFRIQKNGGQNQGSFIWKKEDESNIDYRGTPDFRLLDETDQPFKTFPAGDKESGGYGCSGFYSPSNNREYVAIGSTAKNGHINFCYRTHDDEIGTGSLNNAYTENSGWKSFYLDMKNNFGLFQTSDEYMLLNFCTLKNETILMAYKCQGDINILSSTDGETWSLLSSNIITNAGYSDQGNIGYYSIHHVKMAASGNYVKICMVLKNTGLTHPQLLTLTSTDNGITFSTTDSPDINPISIKNWGGSQSNVVSHNNCWEYEVASLDDKGAFILLTGNDFGGVLTIGLKNYVSVSNEPFTEKENLQYIPTLKIKNIFAHRIDNILYIYTNCWTTCTDYLDKGSILANMNNSGNSFYIDLTEDINSAKIKAFGNNEDLSTNWLNNIYRGRSSTGLLGTEMLLKGTGRMYATPTGLNLITANFLWYWSSTAYIPIYHRGCTLQKIAGWKKRPVAYLPQTGGTFIGNDINYPKGRLFAPEWNISQMPISPVTIFYKSKSAWARNRVGSTSVMDYEYGALRLTNNLTTSGSDYLYWNYTDQVAYHNGFTPTPASPLGTTNFGNVFLNGVTPWRNWIFANTSAIGTGVTQLQDILTPGSCVRWICSTDAASATESGMVVGVSGYIYGNSTNTRRTVSLEIHHNKNRVVVWDKNLHSSFSPSVILDLSSTFGANCLENYFFEFRLAFYPTTSGAGTNSTAKTNWMLLARPSGGRKTGYVAGQTWVGTDLYEPTYAAPTTAPWTQMLYFGHKNKTVSGEQSWWRSIGVCPTSDLDTINVARENITGTYASLPFALAGTTSVNGIKGRPLYYGKTGIGNSVDIIWGGGTGSKGDTFSLSSAYTYPASNVNKFNSPRIHYRTTTSPSTAQSISFKSNTDEYFMHDAFAVHKTNATDIVSYYSNNGSAWSVGGTISLIRAQGIVTEVINNIIKVNWTAAYSSKVLNSQFSSSDKKSYYARFSGIPAGCTMATTDCFKVNKSFDRQTLLLSTEVATSPQKLTAPLVGATIDIYADRGYAVYSSQKTGNYVKFTMIGTTQTAEDYSYMGTVCAGTTYTFDVPLDWEFTDNETPNQEIYNSRSNIRWTYNLGPSMRQLSLTMIGDTTEQKRRELRDQLNSITKYGKNSLCLILEPKSGDSDDQVLVNYSEGTNFENQGWYYDSTNELWRPVGNLSLTFLEII